MIAEAPATVPFPGPSVLDILARQPSRRPGRTGPHYPARANPTVQLPGLPDWRSFGVVNGYPLEFAAQVAPPHIASRGQWMMTPTGIWVGLNMT